MAYRLGPLYMRPYATFSYIKVEDSRLASMLARLEDERRRAEGWTEVHDRLEPDLHHVPVELSCVPRYVRDDETPRRTRNRRDLQAIGDRLLWMTRDDYGRLHTSITGLRSALRPAIRLDGKPVAAVDVSH
jgi:hypothetical protein